VSAHIVIHVGLTDANLLRFLEECCDLSHEEFVNSDSDLWREMCWRRLPRDTAATDTVR
jgi:hypothetical protein